MKKWVLTPLVLGLIFGCSNRTVTEVAQPALQDYQVGEKWVWQYKGATAEGEVRAQGTDTKEIVTDHGEMAMLTANGPIALRDIVTPAAADTGRYNWPLQVGKTWQHHSQWTSEDGTRGETHQDVEVLSYRREQVQAGAFMAFTIRYRGTITNAIGQSTPTEDVIWYAPQLKTFIKLTQTQPGYRYQEELIEYISGG